jgi:predicted phosphodiesterase
MPLAHSQTSTELYNDIYTRRAWKVTRHMHPDLVIFLGDMLRTGRFVESDDE